MTASATDLTHTVSRGHQEVSIVSNFLAEGLISDQPALVIATPAHRAAIVAELGARQLDVETINASGDLLLLDAAEMLTTCMVAGLPIPEQFEASATRAMTPVCRGRKGRTIRAYGEMVDVLWKAGQDVAAVRLEMLWNTLAMTHDLLLLCGYAKENVYKDESLFAICAQHSHVVSADVVLIPTATNTPLN